MKAGIYWKRKYTPQCGSRPEQQLKGPYTEYPWVHIPPTGFPLATSCLPHVTEVVAEVADSNDSEAGVKLQSCKWRLNPHSVWFVADSPFHICQAEKVKRSSLWSFSYLGMES